MTTVLIILGAALSPYLWIWGNAVHIACKGHGDGVS